MFLAEALHNDELADIGINSYHKILNQIIKLVEDSQQQGDIDSELSSIAVAQVLFSLVQGMSSQIIMTGSKKLDIDAYLKATLAMLGGDVFTNK